MARSDEVVLSLQVAIDRLVRRFRRGDRPAVGERRFLIVQIDGLSRTVLEHALRRGYMPFVKRALRSGNYRLDRMAVGLPTSTPAFQMAAMYGVRPDIPGFHYFDRERQSDVHFPRKGHAALIEARHANGRRGILAGGSAYGCVFTGGADNNLFTFTTLTRPSGRGVVAALSPFLVLAWVCLKSLVQTANELVKAVPWLRAHAMRRRQGRRWFAIKVGISVWVRALFTMAACRDLYAGVPAVYVNYLDYDEAAHNFGPRSRFALVSLRRLDRSIRQLWRVARRVPEHRYDLFILADHGQTPCRPYRDVAGGRRFECWIFDHLMAQSTSPSASERDGGSGLVAGIRHRREGTSGLLQHYFNYLDEDYVRHSDPEAHEQNGVRVISAGPNAFLYVLNSAAPLDANALEQRFPGLAEMLSTSPGIGFVLVRSRQGPICFFRGTRYDLRESAPALFADRDDAALVAQGLADLMRMPSAGDLVIYGTGAPEGHVSFIPEVGSHAGPSSSELHTFIIRPANVALPLPITHPSQLYEHFIRYGAQDRPAAPPAA